MHMCMDGWVGKCVCVHVRERNGHFSFAFAIHSFMYPHFTKQCPNLLVSVCSCPC